MKKKFVLVSLQEKKAKRIADVLSNATCRKILDFMSSHDDVTESFLSKELGIPLPTVHYNMKALVDAKLVRSDEFHYSSKGKEVSHYRLANQYVIIAPAGEKASIREKLKSILPVAAIGGFFVSLLKLVFDWSFSSSQASLHAAPVMYDSAVAGVAAEAAPKALAAEPVVKSASLPQPSFLAFLSSHVLGAVVFFLLGAVLAVFAYFLYLWFKRRRNRIKVEV